MKARMSATTAEMNLSEVQRETVRQFLNSELEKYRKAWSRRMLLAVCLALNDLYNFGDKRLGFVLKALEDILSDYAEQAYTPKEARQGAIEIDAMADLMQKELSSRKKIHIVITND
jgi:hypothetical protein